jgi:hypothetical protein
MEPEGSLPVHKSPPLVPVLSQMRFLQNGSVVSKTLADDSDQLLLDAGNSWPSVLSLPAYSMSPTLGRSSLVCCSMHGVRGECQMSSRLALRTAIVWILTAGQISLPAHRWDFVSVMLAQQHLFLGRET